MNSIKTFSKINFRQLNKIQSLGTFKYFSTNTIQFNDSVNEGLKDTKSGGANFHEIILSDSRKITVRLWQNKVRVDIREYSIDEATNNVFPTKKGISLPYDQWRILVDNIEEIESAINKAEAENQS